jgi:quercetin dioxygenase-like cupin family protein
MIRRLLCAVALAAGSLAGAASAHDPSDHKSKVTLVYDQVLPNVPGKSIRGVLVEYEPGGSSAAHTHPDSAFIYATVLEGAIRSQVNDGPVTTYRAGGSFSNFQAIVMASAKTRARLNPRGCSPCSTSISTKQNW